MFEKITKKYLTSFQRSVTNAWATGSSSIELATRPVVHNYVESIMELCKANGSSLVIHHDTNYTTTDRPDWRIEDSSTFGVYCFGDHKSLARSAPFKPTAAEQKQISRYLALGRPVFVFDGIEFIFYKDSLESAIRCQIISKPLSTNVEWADLPIDISAETQIRCLLLNPGFRKWTESQLVQQLAIRARVAADEMASLLTAPIGSGCSSSEELLLRSLHALRETIANHHDPSLRDDRACADFVAQVLTFGLFYAHTRNSEPLTSPIERRDAIKKFWSSANLAKKPEFLRPFKTIAWALSSSLDSNNIVSDWYKEIRAVLAHAEYMGSEAEPQDFHSLFEQFLTTFDEQARFDRGAFYTPSALTNWIAKACDNISRDSFGCPIMDVAEKIIDPCCGTGGFLEAVYLLRSKTQIKQPMLIGFEILPAPYALAHYRLAELFDEDSNPPKFKIVLTDTLADQLLGPISGVSNGSEGELIADSNGFEEELNDAILLSTPPLRLVIGNPPSSSRSASSAERTVIEGKLDAFRPPKLERTDRQNIQKALNNDAYKFLRWCADKAIESGRGILALVMPGAFANSVSFKYARKWLIDNFQEIYILELDGDARRGGVTHSLFSVLQGRLVFFAIRNDDSKYTGTKVFHHDISTESLKSKHSFLATDPKLSSFVSIKPIAPQWRFTPTATYPADLWLKGWPLTSTTANVGIFLQKCSGVKLAPTAMLFHTQKPILIRRTTDLSKANNTYESLRMRWFSGQRKPPTESKLTPAVKNALASAVKSKEVEPYLFRPFVHGFVLNSDQVFAALKQTKGSGVRDRPEVRAAFHAEAIGIAVAPAPSDLGETLTRFACFSWSLPDNDLAARGNAMIYCDRFPKKGAADKSILKENVSNELVELFKFSANPARAIVFYSYAVLSCPTYLDTFEGVLYSTSDPSDPPRVLIASDVEYRKQLVALGEKIAECEKSNYIPNALASLSLSWMPVFTEFSLVKWTYSEATEELKLLGDQQEEIVFTGVPEQCFALRISGHTVIEKWLRERTAAYLVRQFKPSDAEELKILIYAIYDQILLIAQADGIVSDMISSEKVSMPPGRL